MAQLKSTFKNMVISLFGITAVASASLGLVNNMTREAIEGSELKLKNEAVASVLPKYDNQGEAYKALPADGGDSLEIFPVLDASGNVIANAVKTYSNNGYSGYIEIMVGFNKDGVISGYQVLKHTETPGLGSKMGIWFNDTNKPGQNVIGRNIAEGPLKVKKDGGSVDAITAATISSRAFLESVNRAYSVLDNQFDGVSSATKQEGEHQ
jgi:electron transport complex protein RnfG